MLTGAYGYAPKGTEIGRLSRKPGAGFGPSTSRASPAIGAPDRHASKVPSPAAYTPRTGNEIGAQCYRKLSFTRASRYSKFVPFNMDSGKESGTI